MIHLSLSKIKPGDLDAVVTLTERDALSWKWTQVDTIQLRDREQQQVQDLQARLLRERPPLMNEATVWARVIYPLLLLAEQDTIQAWAQVELKAQYKTFEISGIADGVLGHCITGELKTPYLIVVEAKRGLDAENPKYQLYGQLLAAAHMNWQRNAQDPQEIFGCYTIADTWTFTRARISGIDTEKPTLFLESSRDYGEKGEAIAILKILKGIIHRFLPHQDPTTAG